MLTIEDHKAITGVLLDLGGVVYLGDEPMPGSLESIARLKSAGLAVRFITNVTRRSRRSLLEMLARMGLDVAVDELFMPAIAVRHYLEAHGLRPLLLVHPELEEDFADLPRAETQAVIIGDAAKGFTYGALNRAFRALSDGAPLIALAENRFFRDSDGELSLDAGPFVRALEYASGCDALVTDRSARRPWTVMSPEISRLC